MGSIVRGVMNLLRLNIRVDITNIDILETVWISWKSDPSHGTIDVMRVYAPRFLSCQSKDLKWRTLKPPQRVTALGSWTDRVTALRSRTDHVIALRQSVLQLSVTALFYLEDSRKIHLQGVRACRSKDAKRKAPQHAEERASELWLFFLYVFLSLGLSCVNWASQECCLFYLRSSLWSSDLPLFYFRGLFPSLSFSHRHFGLLFPLLPT